jgi:hypothetical protein
VCCRRRGELREGLEPALCAAMLFGSVEMSLTSLVMGLFDAKDPGLLTQAQVQLTSLFLDGVRAEGPEPRRKTGSALRLKPVKRS